MQKRARTHTEEKSFFVDSFLFLPFSSFFFFFFFFFLHSDLHRIAQSFLPFLSLSLSLLFFSQPLKYRTRQARARIDRLTDAAQPTKCRQREKKKDRSTSRVIITYRICKNERRDDRRESEKANAEEYSNNFVLFVLSSTLDTNTWMRREVR